MRYLILAALPIALSACAADGTFKNPLNLTMQEKCDNAALGLAIASANDVDADVLERLQTNVNLLCPAGPVVVAAVE